MPISLILTPFDHFQICPTFAVNPNLILEPCHRFLLAFQWVGLQSMHSESVDDNTKCITHLYFLKKLNLILVYEVLKQAHLKT